MLWSLMSSALSELFLLDCRGTVIPERNYLTDFLIKYANCLVEEKKRREESVKSYVRGH